MHSISTLLKLKIVCATHTKNQLSSSLYYSVYAIKQVIFLLSF